MFQAIFCPSSRA